MDKHIQPLWYIRNKHYKLHRDIIIYSMENYFDDVIPCWFSNYWIWVNIKKPVSTWIRLQLMTHYHVDGSSQKPQLDLTTQATLAACTSVVIVFSYFLESCAECHFDICRHYGTCSQKFLSQLPSKSLWSLQEWGVDYWPPVICPLTSQSQVWHLRKRQKKRQERLKKTCG